MSINNLFATENIAAANNSRNLSGTAQLTSLASDIAATIIRTMNEDIEGYKESIQRSQTDSNFMDELIKQFTAYEEADIDFLKELDEDTIDGMLKSQQSKRSRCKSKAMTLDNYRALMTGAIAENLIRKATGKAKNAVGARRVSGSVEYTIEELEALNADQDKLRKEIRNVQSKKSIMKSKAGFSEDDERWIALCKAEQQLKDMRIGAASVEYIVVDETKGKLKELLEGKDPEHLKAADSKELLVQIAALINAEN